MRCDKFAHWEIRSVMLKLLEWCQKEIPVIFDDFKFFKTEAGNKYARIIMTPTNIAEKIEENGDVENIMKRLSPEKQIEILQYLIKKHWR